MKIKLIAAFIFGVIPIITAQNTEQNIAKDTTNLNEVVIIGRKSLSNFRQPKALASLDEFLESSNKIVMIKRGNYAWEPSLNSMVSERLNVTIDGMQIFGACTDKMDPITSYVDVSNLEKVSVNSGQQGTEFGNVIGGGINLELHKEAFSDKGFKMGIDNGFETNGNYKIFGVDATYAASKFYLIADGIFRKSENYESGNSQEVLYSQFQKINASVVTGYKISESHQIDANLIIDRATDVGYPALPMDVSLAEAFITSLSHTYAPENLYFKSLESKLYFNTITHIMDDTQRPDVPIRMDMPGRSDTFGFYSKAHYNIKKHHITANLNGFYNRSLAEMTMYSTIPNQPDMFMYTWPDIRTLYSGIFINDDIKINDLHSISFGTRVGFHQNGIAKQEGIESLKIFRSNVEQFNNRLLLSINSNYKLSLKNYEVNAGVGYGERAPSVSEGYGFFLFNSFDNYDYIGNPNLANEKAYEASFSIKRHFKKASLSLESSAFYIEDYIIGVIAENTPSMTIGAKGVRLYESLPNAKIFNVALNSNFDILPKLKGQTVLGYSYGNGSDYNSLPLIRPFFYRAEIIYRSHQFGATFQLEGNGNQTRYSSFYGEDQTPAYAILNLNLSNQLVIDNVRAIFKYGVQNLLDREYSTFADWNNIPRPGRNFYINASFVIN